MKNILLISGSNRNGNTNFILSEIEKNIPNSEKILFSKCNIEYCKGCLACYKTNRCMIKDDMDKIINKIIKADLVIFGVPTYFDNVTGLFKNFMDRLNSLYKSEMIKYKKVIFIFTGGGKEDATKEEMDKAVYGLIKYLKLNVIQEYTYQALNAHDVENQTEKIKKMINEIRNI